MSKPIQNAYEMNSDVKALLTLWLLKAGTSPETIQMTLQLAAASRIMAAEEQAAPPPNDKREPRPATLQSFVRSPMPTPPRTGSRLSGSTHQAVDRLLAPPHAMRHATCPPLRPARR
jgi:hypothetical protein